MRSSVLQPLTEKSEEKNNYMLKGEPTMNKVEVNKSEAYNAPGHFDMRAIRLHGPANDCQAFSLGMSHFLPGGGTAYVEPPVELVYFILDGELTVLDKDDNVIEVLGKYDSMHFAAGEGKQILNKTNYITTMLVIASPLPKMD